jgi:hypothetical protein
MFSDIFKIDPRLKEDLIISVCSAVYGILLYIMFGIMV